jgi:hypothetical protein
MTIRAILLASAATLLFVPAAMADNAPPATGKAHVIFIPDIDSPKLKVGDRSARAGLATREAIPTVEGGLTLEISGKTSKGEVFPKSSLDTKNFVYEEYDKALGGEFWGPVGCDGECDSGLFISDNAGSSYLDYSSYFITGADVENGATVGTIMGSGYIGDATSATDMTTLKTGKVKATYEGSFVGLATTVGPEGAEGEIITGDVTLNADFRKGRVTGGITELTFGAEFEEDVMTIDQGLALKGKIKGSEYTGTAKFTKGTGVVKGGGSVSTSALSGGFFGPGAAETAGSLRVEGKITPTVDGVALTDGDGAVVKKAPIAITGSFGAVKPGAPSTD